MYFHLCYTSFEVYERTVPHMYKSLVFGDEFVSHLKSHQRCPAAFCRPVKFFHTDWIIISLWPLTLWITGCASLFSNKRLLELAMSLSSLWRNFDPLFFAELCKIRFSSMNGLFKVWTERKQVDEKIESNIW